MYNLARFVVLLLSLSLTVSALPLLLFGHHVGPRGTSDNAVIPSRLPTRSNNIDSNFNPSDLTPTPSDFPNANPNSSPTPTKLNLELDIPTSTSDLKDTPIRILSHGLKGLRRISALWQKDFKGRSGFGGGPGTGFDRERIKSFERRPGGGDFGFAHGRGGRFRGH